LRGDDGEGRRAPALQKLQTIGSHCRADPSLAENHAFGPDEIRVLTTAFEDTLRTLRLTNRADPVAEIIAKKIIELAQQGERDPVQLREHAIDFLSR